MFQSPHLYLAHLTAQQSCLTGYGETCASCTPVTPRDEDWAFLEIVGSIFPGVDTLERSRLISFGLGGFVPCRCEEVVVVRTLVSFGQTLERERRNDAVSCGSCHVMYP
jgi:hypothetical protein